MIPLFSSSVVPRCNGLKISDCGIGGSFFVPFYHKRFHDIGHWKPRMSKDFFLGDFFRKYFD